MIDAIVDLHETEEPPWIGLRGALEKRFGGEAAREFLERVRALRQPV